MRRGIEWGTARELKIERFRSHDGSLSERWLFYGSLHSQRGRNTQAHMWAFVCYGNKIFGSSASVSCDSFGSPVTVSGGLA